MVRSFRVVTTAALATIVAVTSIAPAYASPQLSRSDYEACQARDEAGLKATISTLSADAFKAGIKNVDYAALVRDQWRKGGVDAIIDSRVDIAIEEVRSETSWAERLKSLANTETSQKLATTVAEKVYRSDAVTAAVETLASGVAAEVGKTIEFVTADATSPLLECLTAFVGPRYGSAVAAAVSGDAGKDLALDPDSGAGGVSAGAVLKQTSGGLAGATILIVRRQLAGLATRVGQRIVGSVLSRLVSVVAGGIGLVLIAKDIWDLRNGVLPIIATEMKASATKDKVQDEIAVTISEQITHHVGDIAASAADQVFEVWQSFKRAHALVLRIAESNGEFRSFLDGVKPDALIRLDEVVALIVAAEGEPAVIARLADGSLYTAVHLMPTQAVEIARDTKSVADALDWSSLAGNQISSVVEFGLHRRAKPADFSRASFATLIGLGDRTAILRLAAIPTDARDTLFALPPTELATLGKSLSESELTTLAGYLQGLTPGPRDTILREVASNPARMKVLASERVRDAIISSEDQAAAAAMMLRPVASFSPRAFGDDLALVWAGRVKGWLLVEKHPVGMALAGLLCVLMLLWLGRLFRPRQHPPTAPTDV